MDARNWLGDLHLFVAVARAKSFTRAATALDIPRSTLSRRIADLEHTIGIRLVNRTTRQVELTEEGERYLARAERIVEDARMAHEDLLGRANRPIGLLKIAMPASVAWHLAIPWLSEFATRYPDIRLELDTAPDHVDPVADQWDVCIHDNAVRDSALTVRQLASFKRSLFASPAYIARRGLPARPEDLALHECICAGPLPGRAIWKLHRGMERVSVAVSGRVACGKLELSPEFAREGMGIAAASTGAYAGAVTSGALVTVLPEWQFEPLIVCAIMPTKLIPAKTRVFLEFFADRMKAVKMQLDIMEGAQHDSGASDRFTCDSGAGRRTSPMQGVDRR